MKREFALLYGAALEGNPPSDVRQFAVTMTPARARLLSTDPRVSEVVEVPSASAPAAAAPTAASPAGHFTSQTSGYGDNGQSGTYTYDSSGNITAIGTDTYLYDLEERLSVSVTRGVTETYVYDAFGNRESATGAVNCLGQTTCAQPVTLDEHTNRLQTINNGSVKYDTAGNVTAIAGTPSTTYSYDGTGMMIQQTVGGDDRQFVYTADDERIAIRQGASWTWTVRDPSDKVLREFTSMETGGSGFAMTNRQWVKDYVWRDGLLLATTTPGGTLHYHLDHLGTPQLITNGSGVKVAEHAYYPFGAEIALTPHETPEEAMKFTGHERDIVAGDGHTLDYMHARYYNGNWGRFLSVDRIPGDPSAPQSWNRYSYARNNPIRRVDPDGDADVDFYVLMDPAKYNAMYNRQWFADRLVDQYGGIAGHTLRVSTDARNSVSNLRTSFSRDGALVGYFGHSEGIHLTGDGYAARGLNPRSNPGQIGISNQQLTSMINAGYAAIAVVAACASNGCFAGGGLNGDTTVVALRSPTGLTDAIVISGALEAFNNVVVKGNGTVAEGVAAANSVFAKYKLKDQFVVVAGDADQRLEKDPK